MPAPMQSYQSMEIGSCHRICWQRSVAGSRVKSKWKWLTSWSSDDYPRVHARLANRSISMNWPCLCYCKCVCWVFGVACGRCNKCMNMKWWSQCMAAETRPKRGIFLSICHPFWVLYMKMSLRLSPMFPTHLAVAVSSLKMQRTKRKTAATQWCAADKCVRTDDDERSGCIWGNEHRKFMRFDIKCTSCQKWNIPVQCYSDHAQQTNCHIWVENNGKNLAQCVTQCPSLQMKNLVEFVASFITRMVHSPYLYIGLPSMAY